MIKVIKNYKVYDYTIEFIKVLKNNKISNKVINDIKDIGGIITKWEEDPSYDVLFSFTIIDENDGSTIGDFYINKNNELLMD